MSKRINVNPDHYKGSGRSARSEAVVEAARRRETASKRAEMRRWLAQRTRERGFKPSPPRPRPVMRPSVDGEPAPTGPEVASSQSAKDADTGRALGRSTRKKRARGSKKAGEPRATAGRGRRKKTRQKKAATRTRTSTSKRTTKKSGGKEKPRRSRAGGKKLSKKKK